MIPEPLPANPNLHAEAHAWIRPGAVFLEAGETKRITEITDGIVRGVSSTGGLWSWPLANVLAASATGRIQPTTVNRPRRPPAAPRERRYIGEASRQQLIAFRSHPLILGSGGDLPRLVLQTLQALERGQPAEPPALQTLLLVAHAGAEAQSLGQHVAAPERKGGKRSKNAAAAQETQQLLARLRAFLVGQGDFTLEELRHTEAFTEAGLRALLPLRQVDDAKAGRPRERSFAVHDVRFRLACRWRDHERGRYSLSQAMREVVEQEVLHAKQFAASWHGNDPNMVALESSDAEDLRRHRESLESAYFHTFSFSSLMSAEERSMHRRTAAKLLRAIRTSGRS